MRFFKRVKEEIQKRFFIEVSLSLGDLIALVLFVGYLVTQAWSLGSRWLE